jgi:excisionase family DNA binding protein
MNVVDEIRASNLAVLTVAYVAGVFDVDERTIRRACADGQLPCIYIGRLLRIPREPLLTILTSPTPQT